MTTFDPPEDWVAPEWHEDYGDPIVGIERLRSLAFAIRKSIPGVIFMLRIPEPGYIEMTATFAGNVSVKLLSVPPVRKGNPCRYGVFGYHGLSNEIEMYFESVDEVVSHLKDVLHSESTE